LLPNNPKSQIVWLDIFINAKLSQFKDHQSINIFKKINKSISINQHSKKKMQDCVRPSDQLERASHICRGHSACFMMYILGVTLSITALVLANYNITQWKILQIVMIVIIAGEIVLGAIALGIKFAERAVMCLLVLVVTTIAILGVGGDVLRYVADGVKLAMFLWFAISARCGRWEQIRFDEDEQEPLLCNSPVGRTVFVA
jgi:hypothetical protein